MINIKSKKKAVAIITLIAVILMVFAPIALANPGGNTGGGGLIEDLVDQTLVLISLLILLAAGYFAIPLFGRGQVMQGFVVIIAAALVLVILNRSILETLGEGIKSFMGI